MIITDSYLLDAIWNRQEFDFQNEEEKNFYEENTGADIDLTNLDMRKFIANNIRGLDIKYGKLEDNYLRQLAALITFCPNIKYLRIQSFSEMVEIDSSILNALFDNISSKRVNLTGKIIVDCDYLLNNISRFKKDSHISIVSLSSKEQEERYLKLPLEEREKITVKNFSTELYREIDTALSRKSVDVDLYFNYREYFYNIDEFNITIDNVSKLNLEKLEIIKKDKKIKRIFIKCGYENDEFGYSIEEYENILKEINNIIAKIKIPSLSDPVREKKIFAQLYQLLGEKIIFDHYALTEEAELDKVLKVECRNLKNGLLGTLRNGKKVCTCVCAGYATILQNCCSLLGIQCEYISSQSKEIVEVPGRVIVGKKGRKYENGTEDPMGHAYNSVTLDGQQYFCDLTWDSPIIRSNGIVDYFLKSFDDFYASHKDSGFNFEDVSVVSLSGERTFRFDKQGYSKTLSNEEIAKLFLVPVQDQIDEMIRIGYLGGFVSECVNFIKECKSKIELQDYYGILTKIQIIEQFILSDDFKRRGRLSAIGMPISVDNKDKIFSFFNPHDNTVEEAIESVERRSNNGR